jgi:hypothetical protein
LNAHVDAGGDLRRCKGNDRLVEKERAVKRSARVMPGMVALALALALVVALTISSVTQAASKPTITGDAVVGGTLTSSSAGDTGLYKWQRCNPSTATCDPAAPHGDGNWPHITRAHQQSYVVTSADIGYFIRVRAKGTSPGEQFVPSDPVGPIPGPSPPDVTIGAASVITETGATLNGTVNPNGLPTTYHFEYGTTTAYGSRAPVPDADAGSGIAPQAVSAAISGLTPGTTYHFRLVARNASGTTTSTDLTVGSDQTFTTKTAPEHGVFLLGEPTSGTPTVRVKFPGDPGFHEIEKLTKIPVGTIVDTRGSKHILMTAATGGPGSQTPDQSVEFYGGLFKINQKSNLNAPATAKLVEKLICGVGGNGKSARASGAGPIAVAAGRNRSKLWGRGSGGYRTSGRGSTGSVVGTTWLTKDTCDGTLTRVTEGVGVSVFDKETKKNVFVGPGEKYFAG